MKKYLLLILAFMLIIIQGCKKEKEKMNTPDIEGQWKLFSSVHYNDMEVITQDYSEHNIIYDFRTNNTLIVSGVVEGVEDYRGHENGTYPYEIIYYDPGTKSLQLMKINSISGEFYFGYSESKKTLRINGPNIRGDYREILRLVRIE